MSERLCFISHFAAPLNFLEYEVSSFSCEEKTPSLLSRYLINRNLNLT